MTSKPTYGWDGDSSQWPAEQKLASLNVDFREKVMRVLGCLTTAGFQWRVVYAWRSVAVQDYLFKAAKTKVRWSFHNATLPGGVPNALAVDVVDKRWGWEPEAQANGFWAALGAAGKAEGLYWGGDWAKFPDVAHLQACENTELARVKRESQGITA